MNICRNYYSIPKLQYKYIYPYCTVLYYKYCTVTVLYICIMLYVQHICVYCMYSMYVCMYVCTVLIICVCVI